MLRRTTAENLPEREIVENFLIVGAGLTGGVIARLLADAGHACEVLDEASHVAGACHTERDVRTGIMMHRFGPHTLHTDRHDIWAFLERFSPIEAYAHRKQAWARGQLYPFPINLETLNRFFSHALDATETLAFLRERAAAHANPSPRTFEEAALAAVGPELYEAFYAGYTRKQWGREPRDLPAFIFGRLPIHLSHDRNVFHHTRQGQPQGGYTQMVERMLDHPRIVVRLGTPFDGRHDRERYRHLFYSGPIDRYFGWSLGRLPYRTLVFEHEHRCGTFQECGTVNYCDLEVPQTRVIEHKHFWPHERHHDTVITYEFSRECGGGDRPYYPIRLAAGNAMFREYAALAAAEGGVSFVGRLGTYRYLDMDKAIGEAMAAATVTLRALADERAIPPFFVSLDGHP